MINLKPKWRNGRRGGLKNRCPNGHVSSTLTFGTIIVNVLTLLVFDTRHYDLSISLFLNISLVHQVILTIF